MSELMKFDLWTYKGILLHIRYQLTKFDVYKANLVPVYKGNIGGQFLLGSSSKKVHKILIRQQLFYHTDTDHTKGGIRQIL